MIESPSERLSRTAAGNYALVALQVSLARWAVYLVLATSASRHVVDPLVVPKVGQDYRDFVMQGRRRSMPRDRPRDLLNPTAGRTRLFPASRGSEGKTRRRILEAIHRSTLGCACRRSAGAGPAAADARSTGNAGLGAPPCWQGTCGGVRLGVLVAGVLSRDATRPSNHCMGCRPDGRFLGWRAVPACRDLAVRVSSPTSESKLRALVDDATGRCPAARRSATTSRCS